MSLEALEKLLAKEGIESDDAYAAPKNFLDTGLPHLNDIICGDPEGGLPDGRIAEIFGESSSGKTMLLSQLFISAQKQGGFAALWDHERSYDIRLSLKQGLDNSKTRWLYKQGKTFEQSLVESIKVARVIREKEMIPHDAPIIHGFDSFASMVPKSKMEKELDENTMNDMTALSRVASAILPAYNQHVSDLGICAVFLNQMAASMEMYGPATKTKGGKSLPFYASVRLGLKGDEIKDKKVVKGKKMTITTKKNKIYMPYQSVQADFFFKRDGSGEFDILGSYVDYLKDIGVIETSGAWIKWGGETFQGTAKLKEHYGAFEDGLEQLVRLHKEWKLEK